MKRMGTLVVGQRPNNFKVKKSSNVKWQKQHQQNMAVLSEI
jgi:hypothetical protein